MHPVFIQGFNIECICRAHHFICDFYFISILLAIFNIKNHANGTYSVFFKTNRVFFHRDAQFYAFLFPAALQF